MTRRHTEADEPDLLTDADARAEREAANAVRQIDAVLDMIDQVAREGQPFRLRATTILTLHGIALDGIDSRAGAFRQGSVTIKKSRHQPPGAHLVGHLVDEMCDWVNDNFGTATALHLCAYVMWRLNWIHPFTDGNGRTSRAVAYLVLCAKLGDRLPGRNTVPEQIAANRDPYYEALEAADEADRGGRLDLSRLESLLKSQLAVQLGDAWHAAQTANTADQTPRRFL